VRVQLQLRIVSDDDTVIRDEVILQLDKSDEASRRSTCAWRNPGICSDGSSTLWSTPRRLPTSPAPLLLRLRTPPARQGTVPDRLPHRGRSIASVKMV
jgi:hypothetical protein